MNELIHLLMLPQTIWVFISIIFIVFIFPLYQSSFGVIGTINSELKKAIDILEQSSDNLKYEDFFDNFEDINDNLSLIKGLKSIWKRFTESLNFNEANRKIYASHRPGYYFNRDAILGGRLNLNEHLAFPNYLIGIGLTFTFMGLAAALYVAQDGLNHGSGQQAIKDLLAVASIKFISSITGILSSIILSFVQRLRLKNLQDLIHKFCGLLEQLTEYKSTEKLLHENFQEQVKHTAALNNMATNIATGIGDILSNQLPTSVAQALQPLAEEIRALVQKFEGSNEDALKKVLEEFIVQLRKSSVDDIDALVDKLKKLTDSIDKLIEKTQSTENDFGSGIDTATTQLVGVLGKFVETFQPIQQSIGAFGESLGALEVIATNIKQAADKLGGSATQNGNSAKKLGDAVEQISLNLNPIQELTKSITQALSAIGTTASQLKDAGGTIASAAGDFKTSATSIKQAGNTFDENAQKLSTVANGMASTVNTLETASRNVSRAAEPLSEAASEFIKAINIIKETEAKMQQNQQQLTTLLVNLEKYSDAIPTLWNQYESRFKQVDDDLAKAFQQLSQGSQEFSASIRDFVIEVDKQFGLAINGLSGAIQDLTDEREQLPINQRQN